jgi:hypothetical protein
MSDEPRSAPRRVIDLGTMTPRQIARRFRCGLFQAEQLRWEARGDWCGDLIEIGADGLARPRDHGEFWNPGPGEARTAPWPDATHGRQPRNKVRRWRKAWAAERSARFAAELAASPDPGDGPDGHDLGRQ